MTLVFVLLAEFMLLAWALRRSGFLLFPHGFMLYIVGAQVFLWLNDAEIVRYEFLQLWTSGAYERYAREIVLLYFAFFLGALACVPSSRVDLRGILANVHLGANAEIVGALLVLFLYFRLFLYWAYLDWDPVWSTDTYLSMGAPQDHGAIGTLLMQSGRWFGAPTMILAAYLGSRKRWGLLLAVLPLVAWHVLFDLASHTRASVYGFASAGLVLLVLSPRRPAAPLVAFGLALVTLLGSLAGRNSGHHGFASIPSYFTNIFLQPIEWGALTNVFEGIFVTAEYFGQEIAYNSTYALLSLSPLLSSIDGYDTALQLYQVRISRYVPNSAVTEVLSFGATYAAVFFGVQFLAGWLSAKVLAREQSLLALIVNSMVLLAAYLQFTYTTRIVFRFFVFSLILSGVMWFLSGRRRIAPSASPRADRPSGRRATLAEGPVLAPILSAAKARRLARAQQQAAPEWR